MSYEVGTRVKLLANEEEGWDEEYGVILEWEGDEMYIVELDEQYKIDECDDLIREVSEDQIEVIQ